MNTMRVAAVQFEHVAGNKSANLLTIRDFVEQASCRAVHLIVFPECCITGYWHLRHLNHDQLCSLAEPVFDGPSCQQLINLAQENGMGIGAGLIESDSNGNLYNSYVVALPDGQAVRHRKIHPFVHPSLQPGMDFTVFDSPFDCRIGVLTCYDNNIGENVRITALKGAELLLAPHQTGGCRSTNPHTMGLIDRELWDNRDTAPQAIQDELRGPKGREWLMRWLPARAHDNGVFLVFSNGVGVDDDEIRTGNAMIIDPYGRIIAESCKAGDDMVVADLDVSLLVENTGKRWIRTRRPELYTPIAVLTGAEQDTRSVRFDDKGV